MVNRNKNLENRLKNRNNWAYTGSLAMKIHANRLGVPFPSNRRIGNINIAAKHPLNLVPAIVSSSSRWRLKQSPNHKHTVFINATNRRQKLNLFPANGVLAPKFNRVQKFGNLPVMSIRSLINQKNKTRNNSFGNNIKKINKNIEFLKLLLSKNNSPSSRRSSPRSRSSPNRNNSLNRFLMNYELLPNPKRTLRF